MGGRSAPIRGRETGLRAAAPASRLCFRVVGGRGLRGLSGRPCEPATPSVPSRRRLGPSHPASAPAPLPGRPAAGQGLPWLPCQPWPALCDILGLFAKYLNVSQRGLPRPLALPRGDDASAAGCRVPGPPGPGRRQGRPSAPALTSRSIACKWHPVSSQGVCSAWKLPWACRGSSPPEGTPRA